MGGKGFERFADLKDLQIYRFADLRDLQICRFEDAVNEGFNF